MTWFPTFPMLPTPSPSLILSWSVTSVYSRQDSLTMAAPPTSIQGIPSYGPTPTPGRLLEGNKVCLPIVLLLLGGCQISTVTSSCMYIRVTVRRMGDQYKWKNFINIDITRDNSSATQSCTSMNLADPLFSLGRWQTCCGCIGWMQ